MSEQNNLAPPGWALTPVAKSTRFDFVVFTHHGFSFILEFPSLGQHASNRAPMPDVYMGVSRAFARWLEFHVPMETKRLHNHLSQAYPWRLKPTDGARVAYRTLGEAWLGLTGTAGVPCPEHDFDGQPGATTGADVILTGCFIETLKTEGGEK